MIGKIILCSFAVFALLAQSANAGTFNEREFKKLKGYTLVEIWTIEDFDGCDYDEIIAFEEDTVLRCKSHGYQYGYNVSAFIFVRTSGGMILDIKMVVDGGVFDMEEI